ncbi:MAG: pseudaminic acid synthase [Succinivibrio sp.]
MGISMYSKNSSPVIVAELSGNHNGSLDRAIELMEIAHECGADAIKIQTYTEDSLTLDSDRPEFKLSGGLWGGQTYYELYKKAKTPREWMKPLFRHAKEHGIFLFSSPFCKDDVDCLEEAGCPVYKIASYELNDIGLIEYCAQKGKPMVMSTGLAFEEEIDRAVEAVRRHGVSDLTLLHCESRYPADPKKFNLQAIPYLKEKYNCKSGLSNHALGDELDIAAVALGADMIEKHFTDDRSKGGVDCAFSMDIADLKKLVSDSRTVAVALGRKGIYLQDDEYAMRSGRRSIYIVKDMKKGDLLREDCVRSVRPALGLEPYLLPSMLGKRAVCDLVKNQPLKAEFFE